MESPLEVLSRAATMVQESANESRLSAKELPTAKWRRDRRFRVASEYQHSLSSQNSSSAISSPPASPPMMVVQSPTLRPLGESTNHTSLQIIESPIDMSVSSTTMKPRASPPPPYREPLPGSSYATTLARPSVITQAPPKRGDSRDSLLLSNRENDNHSNESISMCETVIDEHFRRSLGPDYVALFGKKSPTSTTPSPTPTSTPSPASQLGSTTSMQHSPQLHSNVEIHQHRSSPISSPPIVTVLPQALTTKSPLSPTPSEQHSPLGGKVEPNQVAVAHHHDATSPSPLPTNSIVSVPSPSSTPSVDDHFAKALGDTWKKLQADKEQRN